MFLLRSIANIGMGKKGYKQIHIRNIYVEYNNVIIQNLQKVSGLIEVSNGYFYTSYVPEFVGIC